MSIKGRRPIGKKAMTPSERQQRVRQYQSAELELRRWCIEQALRWPSDYSSMNVYPQTPRPADPILRAREILNWVKEK